MPKKPSLDFLELSKTEYVLLNNMTYADAPGLLNTHIMSSY